jgi:hypothetical protein
VRAPAGQLRMAGQLDPAAGPQQRGPRVGIGQVGRRVRENPGQDAAAHIARRIEAAAEAKGDVVAVQQRLEAPQARETLRVGRPGRMIGTDMRG